MSPTLRRIHRQLIFILSRYFVSVAAPEKARQVALSKRWNAAMGCRTDEVALALLAQLTELQHRNIGETSEGQVDNPRDHDGQDRRARGNRTLNYLDASN